MRLHFSMNRLATPFLLILLASGVATAQDNPADRVTGLTPERPSLGSEQVVEYLKAVTSATTNFEFQTAGESRKTFGTSRIKMTATWRKPRGGGAPVMTSATIRPADGRYLKLGDHKINKLTINSKGEIKVDRKGIDVTVYKITRDKHGNMVLDLPWWAFGDVTIPKEDVFLDISKWPPRLDEVVQAFMKDDKKKKKAATKHAGVIKWDVRGRAAPHGFPFKGGDVKAASTFSIKGAGRLSPDGTFRTIGRGNSATLTLDVRDSHYSKDSGRLDVDVKRGKATYNGRYNVSVPGGDGKKFSLEVDGNLHYEVEGNNITMRVPSGTKIHGNHALLSGDGRLVGKIGPGGSNVALRDGTYNLKIDGPVGITGLKTEHFGLDDLNAEGTITSSGKVEELSAKRLAISGTGEGELKVRDTGNMRGARGVLSGDKAGTLTAGLERGDVKFKFDEAKIETKFPTKPGEDTKVKARLRGDTSGSLTLRDTKYVGPKGTADLNRVRTDFDLRNLDIGRLGDPENNAVRDGRGTVKVTALDGGKVTANGLPGLPRLPPGRRTHKVVSGDTLHKLARKFGVPTNAIRDANGIPRDSSLIKVGQVLEIPGGAPQQPAPENVRGSVATRVQPGTEVEADISKVKIGPKGLVVEGHAAAKLKLNTLDLQAGTMQAKILGAAQAGLARTAFKLAPDANGRYRIKVDSIEVPVRIDLSKGSRLHSTMPIGGSTGREMDITFDKDGSYAEFTVKVGTGADGKLKIKELDKVDMLLHSNDATKFAGEVVDISGDKTVRYTGKLVLLDRGLDFFGDITIKVSGDETRPALRIRW